MTNAQQLPLFKEKRALSKRTSLHDMISPFQNFLRNEGKSVNTIKSFSSDMRLLCQYFGEDKQIGALSTRDLNHFLDWLENGRGRPCSQKSYARRVTTIKVLFKWLNEIKVLDTNPSKPILQRSGPAPLQPILSQMDVHRLLDFTAQQRTAKKPDARPDLLVRLILDTAIKKSEAMNIALTHIQRSNEDKPFVIIKHKNVQNLYKERRLALQPDWLVVLDEYLVQYQPKGTLFNCTARNLEYVLRDTAMAAGIESKISFEILRWTSAVRAHLNGIDMDTLRENMGLSAVSWRETSQKIVQLAGRYVAQSR